MSSTRECHETVVDGENTVRSVTLLDRYRSALERDPRRLAYAHSDGTTLTRLELWDRAAEIAEQLSTAGIGPRDIVTVCLPNGRAWVPVYLAVLQIGAVPSTLPSTTETPALVGACLRTGARALITTGDRLASKSGRSIPDPFRESPTSSTVSILHAGNGDELSMTILPAADGFDPAAETFDQLMFTSGTTGLPRAVMHTEESLAALNRGLAETYRLSEDTPLFMGSPLGHATGIMHGVRLSFFLGAPLIVQQKWDAAQAISLIEKYGCEFSIAATPFLRDFVDSVTASGRAPRRFLRVFLCGGAPVPATLVTEAQRLMPGLFVSPEWAMTEGGLTACDESDPTDKLPTTVGRTRCGLEVKVVDTDGAECATGETGELVMRGPGVFKGYLGNEEIYRSSLVDDGFFRTGDLASIDADGFVAIKGRIKDLIIRGGVNIAPLPIETLLARHPDIDQVAVIGQPDERMGQRICAVVVTRREELRLEEIQVWLDSQDVSKRMWPEVLRAIPALPMTAAGKVAKHTLSKNLFESEASLAI